MAEPPRYLCICADDFGMSAGINSAVFELAERRKISATSGMVRREAWLAGAMVLRRLEPAEFDTGLHLDLTRPVHPGGPEPGLGGLLARTWTRTIFAPGLQADIRDQFARFEDAMGRAPAFVDGHRHVHQFPVVRDLLVEEIMRRYASSPPWIRNTAPGWRHGPDRLKAGVIHALGGARLAALAARRGIPTSNRLLGVYDFSGDMHRHEQRLREWLSACRTGDVLMCHPSAGIMPGDPHGDARLREYKALLALPLEAGRNSGITLAPLSRCLRRG
ncbi:ChbG/HpnK family deacetylase [Variovorax sp. CAN2819]|uniref:ChbG/HpnK family deacetylase n=1 Tax=Variovorax sp. CAN15 TaxID=3046727 RepID=UPI0026498767|nr:ChbG/HpnK family deacetylase [Variovorax sp. CAN15]MDN6884254.1 ChbG/HpnK family deacetylase [Variovorax sp. CAN15]